MHAGNCKTELSNMWQTCGKLPTIIDYCANSSSFTRLLNFSKYEMLMFGGMNRSPSSRLSERQGSKMAENNFLCSSSNPFESRVDQKSLPIGTSQASSDDTCIACD